MFHIKLAMWQNKRYTKTHSQSDGKGERSVQLQEKPVMFADVCLCDDARSDYKQQNPFSKAKKREKKTRKTSLFVSICVLCAVFRV